MANELELTVANPDARLLTKTLEEQIREAACFVDWFRGDPLNVTQAAGKVSALATLSASGKAFAQASAAQQGVLTDAAIGVYPALSFSGVEYYTMASAPDPELAHTWALIYKRGPLADAVLFGSRTDSSNQTNFKVIGADDTVAYTHGSGICIAEHQGAGWNVAIMGHDTVDAYLSVNGGAYEVDPTNNQGGHTTYVLGAMTGVPSLPWTGGFADAILLSGDPVTNQAVVDLILATANHVYGIDVG